MAVKQNAIDHTHEFPLAAEVERSFYVDDCLSGAASPELAIMLQQQLNGLFSCGGYSESGIQMILQSCKTFQKNSGTLAMFKLSPNHMNTPRPLVLN